MSENRKLAAILAADVVGYSRLASADEDRTLARLRALRSDLIDPIIAVHNGRVVKRTGDGALVEFRSVVDAVRCAIEVQARRGCLRARQVHRTRAELCPGSLRARHGARYQRTPARSAAAHRAGDASQPAGPIFPAILGATRRGISLPGTVGGGGRVGRAVAARTKHPVVSLGDIGRRTGAPWSAGRRTPQHQGLARAP